MSMRKPLEEGLERLKGIIGDMAAASLEAFKGAIEGILMGKDLKDVRMLSEQLQFMMEQVGELAVELIARFQPVASDLRLIRSCLQVSYDFSRIGRYSLDVSEVSRIVSGETCDFKQLKKIYDIVVYMVREAGRAFIFEDLELARQIILLDDDVDRLYNEYLNSLIRAGRKLNPACIVSGTLILRHLERIADHACYIADAVAYMKTGQYGVEIR